MAGIRVQIEHPTTHERYEVSLPDFGAARLYRDPATDEARTYAEAGFRITANADGTAYEAPAAAAPQQDRPLAETELKTEEPAPKAAERKGHHRG